MTWGSWLGRVLGLSAACVACGGTPRGRVAGAPNVLLIVMDTTRADRCSVNGYQRGTTPAMEALAREGVNYSNAWTPAQWTAPAHASLFTGQRPDHHGLLLGNRSFLLEESVTVAERFKDAGYATAAFSNNYFVAPEYGLTQGFEHLDPLYATTTEEGFGAHRTHELAAEWALSVNARGQRFFMFINNMEPHVPYSPAPDFAQRFVPPDVTSDELTAARGFDFISGIRYNLGLLQLSERNRAVLSGMYDGEVATLDQAIGELIAQLRAAGVLDNTIVVVTADHGENLGDHGLFDHKFSLHRTLLHVPLIMRYPARIAGGQKVDHLVRLEDVAPTLLELAGLPALKDIDGVSLNNDLEGRVALAVSGNSADLIPGLAKLVVGADLSKLSRSIRSVSDGRHHYLEYSDGKTELFDVQQDPHELRDLASEQPEVAKRLRARLPLPPGP